MRAVAVACAWMALSCGSTGGDTIDFPLAAAGPADAVAGSPLEFSNDKGWHVVLSKATLHIGGVYLNESRPISGGQALECFLEGTYVAQQTSALTVDLLTPALQRFPALMHGTTTPAQVGQVWLTGARIDDTKDRTPILVIEGVADRAGVSKKFLGALRMGANQQLKKGDLPGAFPPCKDRIVAPVDAEITVRPVGGLVLRIDPRKFFGGVDFGALPNGTFSDGSKSTQDTLLSTNLHAAQKGGPYVFEWADDL